MRPQNSQGGGIMPIRNPIVERLLASRPQTVDEAVEHIRSLAEALRAAEQELADFVYKVSHDMNAPLRAIRSYAEFLQEDYGDVLVGEGHKYVERLQVNAEAASAQLLGLLEYSRIGRWAKPWETLDLEALVPDVAQKFAERCEERGIEIRVSSGLPTIQGERQRIVQLFEILIENAVLYRNQDGGFVAIGPDAGAPDHGVVVHDDGIGIPTEQRERVFRVFERLCPDDFPGVGMGLALARRIVDYHKGRIWVEDGPGGGAAFRIRFAPPSEQKVASAPA